MVGDYLLQNDRMAVNKSRRGWAGLAACANHCMVYAACVGLAVAMGGWRQPLSNDWIGAFCTAYAIAFVCHWPIDRFGLAGKFEKWFGQTLPDDLESVTLRNIGVSPLDPNAEVTVYKGPRQYFWAPVYIAVDNTMHLVLMWLLLSFLGR